jgi:hypothetical protein
MSKKNFVLAVLVLVAVLFSSALAQPTIYGGRRSYWSDLEPANHNWNSPNNWWTVDMYYIDDNEDGTWDFQPVLEEKWYVKVDQNMVPDIDITAFIGKGELRADYPEELAALITAGFVMTDPTMDSGTFDANWVDLGGGDSAVSSSDPNRHHYLTVTGGTLDIGTPNDVDWYRYWYSWDDVFTGTESGDMFGGQWVGPALRIGIVSNGSGTMNMTGGTVNVGGHIELGGWGGTGELYMDGGTINITQGLYCPGSLYGSIGRVYLNGGTINAGYLNIHTQPSWWPGLASATGEIDFAGGIMKLDGQDEVEVVQNYASGDVPGATITAYGVPSGELVVEGPESGKRAFLNIAYTTDDKTTIHAVTTDVAQAWGPTPTDGSADVRGPSDDLARPILEWLPGDDVATHDVYFGADFNEVNDAIDTDPNVFMVTLPEEDVNYVYGEDLVSLTTYYWRIDETKGSTVTKGNVWRFTGADFEKAAHPVPQDNAVNVFPAELTWTPGIYADTHNVYFSTDFNDVNERDPNFMDNVGTNVYPLTGLQFETTYYWRVDEVNSLGIPYPGDLWTFTITDHINIDDFDDYLASYLLDDIWKGYSYNETAAEIKLGTSIFYGGTQSMEFGYRNEYSDDLYYSEAEADIADLEIGPDWTTGGAEAVVIHFYGLLNNVADANNQMYFAVEDTDSNIAVITYPDVTALQEAEWHEWNISLQEFEDAGVDVTDIEKVYIGFGDRSIYPKPTGPVTAPQSFVYFDELEAWPRKCAPQASFSYGDLNGDCIVDSCDVAEMVEDWLVSDYNTIGFDGEFWYFPLEGEPNYDECWVEGRTGEAGDFGLEFGYEHERDLNEWPISDDFVAVPPLDLYSNIMTITAWVKIHGLQRDDAAIFYCDGVHDDPIWLGDTVAGFNIGIGTDNSLGYMWPTARGGTWQWDPAVPVLPDREWAFCAMVVDPDDGVIYFKLPEGDLVYDKNLGQGHLIAKWETPATLGMHKWRNFDGVMDDVRIFKDSLSYEEILWLATDGEAEFSEDPGLPFIWYKFDEGTGLMVEDFGEGGIVYHPNPSKANLYEDQDEEPVYQRYVNFKDYSILADNWLRDLTFPIE